METSLIPIEIPDPVAVFVGGGIDSILAKVEEKANEKAGDLSAETSEGRKEIVSLAYKIARSKTIIDDIGKNLVSDWKKKAGEVDETRKRSRDFLDSLKDKIRKPVTEYEDAEKRKEEEERTRKQREIEEREAEVARKEKEIRDTEEAARLEKERAEREETIREEARERAEKNAAEAIERSKHDAEMAEKRRVEAEEKAKIDKELAVKKAQEQIRQKLEQERIAEEAEAAEQKKKTDVAAADRDHQAKINREVLACFVKNGFSEADGKKIMTLVAKGQIVHMAINY